MASTSFSLPSFNFLKNYLLETLINLSESKTLVYSPNACSGWVGLGLKPGAQSLVTGPVWQGPNYLGQQYSLPGFALVGSWSQEPELGCETRHPDVASGHLNHWTKCLLLITET